VVGNAIEQNPELIFDLCETRSRLLAEKQVNA